MKNAIKKEFVLAIVFILYLLVDMKTPITLAGMVDTFAGNALVWAGALALFTCCSTPLAMLGLFVAYVFIERSKRGNFVPSEMSRSADMERYNDFPFTLEEEVISNVPTLLDGSGYVSGHSGYAPI